MPQIEEIGSDMEETPAFLNLREVPGISFFEDQRSKDRQISCILAHEDLTMLKKVIIWRLNKSPDEIAKEMEATIERIKKEEGKVMQRCEEAVDPERILLIEHREKPKLYISKFSGSLKALSRWMNGEERVVNGVYEMVAQPHLRSWVLGRTDQAGHHSISNDVKQNLQYYKDSGRWSEIVEVPWESLAKMER